MSLKEKIGPDGADRLYKYDLFTAYAIHEMKYDLHLLHPTVPKYKLLQAAKDINKINHKEFERIMHQSGKLSPDQKMDYEIYVLSKCVSLLELAGFSESAQQLAKVSIPIEMAKKLGGTILEEIVDDGIKYQRSVAASGSRHPKKQEIIDVIRETWITFPWGSRNKMVSYVTDNYRVVEKTLKTWMKEEGLEPLEDVKNKKFYLIIPEKWKKTPGVISAITK